MLWNTGPASRGICKKGHNRAEQELRDALARIGKYRDAYLVEANDSGTVVTVGYRTQRIKGK